MSRVLMVDDAGLFRSLEATFLRRRGCDIVRAAAPSDLLEKARRDRPDLIVIDADHPGLDAPACLRTLKSDPLLCDLPVMVVGDEAGLEPCFAAGADVGIAKPLHPGALEMAVGTLGAIGSRGGVRRCARLVAHLDPDAGGGRRRCHVKDISPTGLFLALSRPLPLEATVTLSLKVPGHGGEQSIRARGVVVRQVPDDPDSHLIAGVGVRFTELDARALSLITRYVGATDADVPPSGAPARP